MDTGCAHLDYATSCGLGAGSADVVAAVTLPAGLPVDVEVTAHAVGAVSVAMAGQCADSATELACGPNHLAAPGRSIARVRARAVGSANQATSYAVYVETGAPESVTLDVAILPSQPPPTNTACATATAMTIGAPVSVDLLDGPANVASACASPVGYLVYKLDIASTTPVSINVASTDGNGTPVVSLRNANCVAPADEITCATSTTDATVQLDRTLAGGTYYVAIGATAPTWLTISVN